MSPDTLQTVFNIFMMLGLGISGLFAGLRSKQVKKLEEKIPAPPSDEALARDKQVLRDEINREVGVQLDKAKQQIKALETDNEKNKREIESLKSSITNKDTEIMALNKQVSRLEREHEEEETERKAEAKRANEAEKEKASLSAKLEVYEVAMRIVQDTIARPIHITLSLDGVMAKEVKNEESKADVTSETKQG